jgi:hypothetical protein
MEITIKLIISARRDFLQAFGSNSFCIFPVHCELKRIPEPCQEFLAANEVRQDAPWGPV